MSEQRTITTEAELDALPLGSVILVNETAMQRQFRSAWFEASAYDVPMTSKEVARYLDSGCSAILLHEGQDHA